MGPRLCSRGDEDLSQYLGVDVAASMGPRLCSRGDGSVAPTHRALAGASMGPRLCSRGDLWRWTGMGKSILLQWGRGFVAAETKTWN